MDLSVQGLPRVPVPLAVTGCPPGRPDAHAPGAPIRLNDAVAAPATSTMPSVFLPRICFLLRLVTSPSGPSVGGSPSPRRYAVELHRVGRRSRAAGVTTGAPEAAA